MPKHIPPITSKRTKQVANRIAEQLAGYDYPDLTHADMDTMRDTGGFLVSREADDPPQEVQDTIKARTAAFRERAIAAGELGREYSEERLRIRWE